MRITYIHQHFRMPDERGGSRPWEFARRLAADGHKVTVLCGGDHPLDIEREGVRILRARVPYANKMGFKRRILSFFRFMMFATRESVLLPTDVVLASSTPLTAAVPGIARSVLRKTPFIFEVRDLWPTVPIELGILQNRALIRLARSLEKLAYNRATSIIALSPSMAAGVKEVAPKAAVHLIPNSSDIKLFRRSLTEVAKQREALAWQEKATLIYCGSFGRIYDLQWAIRLASELRDDECRVILVGEGALSEQLHKLCSELGMQPGNILIGPKTKGEVADLISSADIVLSTLIDHPALEGSSLNKVFDAMAAARPVVFNHSGWLAEKMVAAGAGWILDRDPEIAAIYIRKLIANPYLLTDAGMRSGEFGSNEFSRDHVYDEFQRVICSAADSTH